MPWAEDIISDSAEHNCSVEFFKILTWFSSTRLPVRFLRSVIENQLMSAHSYIAYCLWYFVCHTVTQFNLLKPTGHVMHQQFNIQQLYVLPTLYLCVLYLSENKQRLVPLTT